MQTQVMFYGSKLKAQVLLACVQASIMGVRKDSDRGHPSSRAILNNYVKELEEIESDLVALINQARTPADNGHAGDSIGAGYTPSGPVHEL